MIFNEWDLSTANQLKNIVDDKEDLPEILAYKSTF